MVKLYCCEKQMKFSSWWEFIHHLVVDHGYSEEAARDHAMCLVKHQVHYKEEVAA
jgi:hypothetical protein